MSNGALTATVYVALACGFGVLELVARFSPLPVPTLATTLGHVMRRRSGQIGLLLVWWWVGWHFFAG